MIPRSFDSVLCSIEAVLSISDQAVVYFRVVVLSKGQRSVTRQTKISS